MTTYKIIRKYFDMNHPDHNKVLYTNVPLLQAQRHCKMQHTRLENVWFDCYDAEPPRFDKYGDPIEVNDDNEN